jgi:hypothetical protein
LQAAGCLVERHDDHFGPLTPDETWLPFVAKKGWIALSHNKKMRRVAFQRDIAMRSGLALFFLIGKNHDDYMRNLIVTLPRVISFRESHDPPFIAHIVRPEPKFPVGSRPGRVDMVLTKEQWLALLSRPPRS